VKFVMVGRLALPTAAAEASGVVPVCRIIDLAFADAAEPRAGLGSL